MHKLKLRSNRHLDFLAWKNKEKWKNTLLKILNSLKTSGAK